MYQFYVTMKTDNGRKTTVDITHGNNETREQIINDEEYYTQIGYSAGVYGCNGMLLKGHKTGKLYAVTSRTSAIYIF